MGHTLVVRFQNDDLAPVLSLLSKWDGEPVNKIPFGRKCDRDAANHVLPFHMTMLHWARSDDAEMLPKVQRISFSSLTVIADGLNILPAEENSRLLYLQIKPKAAYEEWVSTQKSSLGAVFPSFFHVTLAVSKNASEVDNLAQYLKSNLSFPFELKICNLELYHIWNPVQLIQVWRDTNN